MARSISCGAAPTRTTPPSQPTPNLARWPISLHPIRTTSTDCKSQLMQLLPTLHFLCHRWILISTLRTRRRAWMHLRLITPQRYLAVRPAAPRLSLTTRTWSLPRTKAHPSPIHTLRPTLLLLHCHRCSTEPGRSQRPPVRQDWAGKFPLHRTWRFMIHSLHLFMIGGVNPRQRIGSRLRWLKELRRS